MEKFFQPYAVGLFAQVAGTVALEFQDVMRQRVDETRAQRERLRGELLKLEGVLVYPSAANFLLTRFSKDHQAILKAFSEQNIVVRDVSTIAGLEDCLRITIGTPEETDRVISCVKSVCS